LKHLQRLAASCQPADVTVMGVGRSDYEVWGSVVSSPAEKWCILFVIELVW